MSWSRRRVLGAAGLLAGASAAGILGRAAAADQDLGSRRIVLKNLHNPESLDIVYRRGDDYLPETMDRIEVLLRDYRTGAQHPIDPHLMDYLYDAAQRWRVSPAPQMPLHRRRAPRGDIHPDN